MSDLRERAPGHALIEQLLHQWDLGAIHLDSASRVVIDDSAVSWYQGVMGERIVARRLAELDPRWTVLHSVPVGKGNSDIDHVVVGPAGVFTINTKNSPGNTVSVVGRNINVGGFPRHYVRNSLAEARRAADLLSIATGLTVPVTGVVAFIDPGAMTIKERAGGTDTDPEIRVVRDRELVDSLGGRRIFSDEQVSRIADAAARESTWRTISKPWTSGEHIAREFEALEEAVGRQMELAQAAKVAARATRPRNQKIWTPRVARTARPSHPRAGARPNYTRPTYVNPRRRRRKNGTLGSLMFAVVLLMASYAWLQHYLTQ